MWMRMGEEPTAFERLFRGHQLAVHRYALRRVGERAVDDVVAETFLVAWRRHDEIVGDPLPWLLGVARRVCANHLRASVRQASLGRRLAAESLPFSEDAPIADGGLKQALGRLGERDREVLLLVAWDELSNRDAAKVLGCSTAAFAVRLHRARARLAQALDEADARAAAFNESGGMAISDAH
jgi:RNA polymerase sigma-70 factor (ECF subfamily)